MRAGTVDNGDIVDKEEETGERWKGERQEVDRGGNNLVEERIKEERGDREEKKSRGDETVEK